MNILSIITFILAFESSRKAHFIFRSILDFLHIICFYLFKQKINIYHAFVAELVFYLNNVTAYYAADLYRYFEKRGDVETGEIYYCKKDLAGVSYDKGILEEISYNLQHSRNNVVVTYLWKLGRD